MIKQLSPTDFKIYQHLRLSSLKTDPEAFISTHEEESQREDTYFYNRIQYSTKEPSFGYYVYFHNNLPVAYAQLGFDYYPKKSHISYLYELYVLPDYRHQGIAKNLLTHIIQKALENPQLEQLLLRVCAANNSAINLYQQSGFLLTTTQPNAIKEASATYHSELTYSLNLLGHS